MGLPAPLLLTPAASVTSEEGRAFEWGLLKEERCWGRPPGHAHDVPEALSGRESHRPAEAELGLPQSYRRLCVQPGSGKRGILSLLDGRVLHEILLKTGQQTGQSVPGQWVEFSDVGWDRRAVCGNVSLGHSGSTLRAAQQGGPSFCL